MIPQRPAYPFYQKANKLVAADSLMVYRFLVGILLAFGVLRQWYYGWIEQQYIRPDFFFFYEGFSWVKPYSQEFIYFLFAALFLSSLGMAFGWRPKLSAAISFFCFTYIELIDKTNYLNHYYFISIILFGFALMPSLPGLWGRQQLRFFWLFLFRFQVGVVYVFAGLAKLGSDWLLEAQPLSIWLKATGYVPILSQFLEMNYVPYIMSWAGAFFDLFVVFFLIYPRTRIPAYLCVILFHVVTWVLFPIGLFPWVMIAGAALFFPPTWPRRMILIKSKFASPKNRCIRCPQPIPYPLIALAVLYVLIQVLLPLRSLTYRGNTLWTEEGFRFSWKVMLIEKAGFARFTIHYSNGSTEVIYPSDWLTPLQVKMMSTQSDMIIQFAHHLEDRFDHRSIEAIFVDSKVSFNGRRAQTFIRPDANLLQYTSLEGAQIVETLQVGLL
ncbi:MAG: HTTM domain-containing protein [Pseudobacteriovorax sp.]|nr:HTTM domain-containing protein [Pseudobacteriovorax sp.]